MQKNLRSCERWPHGLPPGYEHAHGFKGFSKAFLNHQAKFYPFITTTVTSTVTRRSISNHWAEGTKAVDSLMLTLSPNKLAKDKRVLGQTIVLHYSAFTRP